MCWFYSVFSWDWKCFCNQIQYVQTIFCVSDFGKQTHARQQPAHCVCQQSLQQEDSQTLSSCKEVAYKCLPKNSCMKQQHFPAGSFVAAQPSSPLSSDCDRVLCIRNINGCFVTFSGISVLFILCNQFHVVAFVQSRGDLLNEKCLRKESKAEHVEVTELPVLFNSTFFLPPGQGDKVFFVNLGTEFRLHS